MGLVAFFGYGLLGLGPLAALFSLHIAHKSFLILVTLFTATWFLLPLLLAAALTRPATPLEPEAGPYAGAVICAVALQEAFRFLLAWAHSKMLLALQRVAVESPAGKLTELETQELALAEGVGHAATTAVFFFLAPLQIALSDATYVSPSCRSMNYFLAAALQTLGFTLLHTFSMPLFMDALPPAPHGAALLGDGAPRGFPRMNWLRAGSVSAVHLAAGLVTVGGFSGDGESCLATIPVVLAIGLAVAAGGSLVIVRRVRGSAARVSAGEVGGGSVAGAAAPGAEGAPREREGGPVRRRGRD